VLDAIALAIWDNLEEAVMLLKEGLLKKVEEAGL
jgi:hypothetical protein